jgi:DNA-binding NarL/FixJ family response regulator
MNLAKVKVVIADDHRLFVEGLVSILKTVDFIDLVGTFSNGNDLLNEISKLAPHILLLDLDMPGKDGVEVIKKLKIRHPEIKIIVISMHMEPGYVRPVLNLGINAYLLKETSKEELLFAIEKVINDEQYIGKSLKKELEELQDFTKRGVAISSRELEVLKYLAQGKKTNEIADILNLSHHTIDSHRKSMLKKLKMHNSLELIQYAVKNKLI